MKKTQTDKLFEKVLTRFSYRMVDNVLYPVLTEDSIVELFTFITNGVKAMQAEQGLEDSNEGDNGSHQDQAPEDFI